MTQAMYLAREKYKGGHTDVRCNRKSRKITTEVNGKGQIIADQDKEEGTIQWKINITQINNEAAIQGLQEDHMYNKRQN